MSDTGFEEDGFRAKGWGEKQGTGEANALDLGEFGQTRPLPGTRQDDIQPSVYPSIPEIRWDLTEVILKRCDLGEAIWMVDL